MNLALYYPWLYLTSGAERSIMELARRSRHNWTIYTNHFDRECTYPGFKDLNVVELARVPVERSFSKVMGAAARIALQKIDLSRFEALMVVCEGIGDMVVFRNHEKPVVCLCLTPLRPVFDPFYKEMYARQRGRAARVKIRLFGQVFKFLDRLAWKRYDHVLCISRESRKRVLEGKLTEESKIGFAFPGIDLDKFRPSGRSEKHFLLPGRIMWTKNIELGIQAYKRFRDRFRRGGEFRLIVAGIVDKKSEPYCRSLRELAGSSNGIEFVIHPSDEELFNLYDRAYAVLFTPFNEDWGMVPLEAMAYAKPVIAVNRGGSVETVIHGQNGFLSEPKAENFADYMLKLAADPELARLMGENGRRRVARYDWKYFVKTIDDSILAVCSRTEE